MAARRSSTTTSTSVQVARSQSVIVYVFGPSLGMLSRSGVLRKSLAIAPSNSASEEMAESSQQSPTSP